MTTEPLDLDAIRANYAHPDRLMAAPPILVHNLAAEVDRLQLQHQGQAEHITLLRTAVDRLTAALIERDTELTRLRAAEQRVRALCETFYVVSTDDVLDILDDDEDRDLSGLADLGYDAALDGGQP